MSHAVQMNGGSTTGTGVPPGSGPTGPEHAAAHIAVQQAALAAAQGVPLCVNQGIPQGMPHGVPQGVPQGMPQVMPQALPPCLPQGVPQGVPQGIPQGMPPGNLQSVPQCNVHPGVHGMPHPVTPHAQLNGGSKTGIGVKRVPPPVRTVSLPGASGKPPLPGPGSSNSKSPLHVVSQDSRHSDSSGETTGNSCHASLLLLDVLKNLGVCILVLLYLLLGAFVFLAMNEDLWDPTVIPVVSGPLPGANGSMGSSGPGSDQQLSRLQLAILESRTKTIERIWDITVNLNILYRDNWTELAGKEIERFQNQLVERLAQEMDTMHQVRRVWDAAAPDDALPLPAPPLPPSTGAVTVHRPRLRVFHHHSVRWNFAQAFLFSLTVITTIGYGSLTPLTGPGKAATMVYAALGIPLMLLYLSAVGGLLARCARGVFTRAVCCCLCSKCGYCCYDETRMIEKERRMRRRRQELEMKLSTAPYYVRASDPPAYTRPGSSPRLRSSPHSGGGHSGSMVGSVFSGPVLAPVLLCGAIMLCYVMGGAVTLWGMRAFQFLDCVFFCFMSLTTIGFGNLIPGAALVERGGRSAHHDIDVILWFCSAYILIGMALTTMCCNVVYTVLLHAIRHAGSKHRQ